MKKNMQKEDIRKFLSIAVLISLIFSGTLMTTPIEAKIPQRTRVLDRARTATKSDVVHIILPTETEHVFDFIMDPQELIRQTDAAAYNYCSFEEDATLFFKRSDRQTEEDYSRFSDALTITNKGNVPIEIEVTATVASDSVAGIAMTDDEEFTDDSRASLYLALMDEENTAAIDREEGASIEVILDGTSNEDEEDSSYSFWLAGAVNRNGDWSKVTEVTPKVTVTWKICVEEDSADEEEEEEPRPKGKKKMEVQAKKENEALKEDEESKGSASLLASPSTASKK